MERGCYNCGAILGGYGVRIGGKAYCSTGCFEEANEEEKEEDEDEETESGLPDMQE